MYDCRLCAYEDECDYVNCRWSSEDDSWYQKQKEETGQKPEKIEVAITLSNDQSDLEELLPMSEEIIQYLMAGCEHQGICEGCAFEYSQTGNCLICIQSRNAAKLIRSLMDERTLLKGPAL